MGEYTIQVTELWCRTYTGEAKTREDAVAGALTQWCNDTRVGEQSGVVFVDRWIEDEDVEWGED